MIPASYAFAQEGETAPKGAPAAITSTPPQAAQTPEAAVADADTKVAEPAEEDAAPAEVHRGLYVRLSLGVGYANFAADRSGVSHTLSGAAILPELQLGFSVVDNLIIHGGLSMVAMVEPEYERSENGKTITYSDAGMIALNAGPGITYYTDFNMLLGMNLGLSYFTSTGVIGDAGSRRLGIAVQALVGYEWWVTEHTGLGLSATYMFAAYPAAFDGPGDVDWIGHTAGLMMTASYN